MTTCTVTCKFDPAATSFQERIRELLEREIKAGEPICLALK